MKAMARGKRMRAAFASVQGRDGKWVANGTFGDPDRRMHPVDIAIEIANNEVVLRFTEPGKSPGPVVLTLYPALACLTAPYRASACLTVGSWWNVQQGAAQVGLDWY